MKREDELLKKIAELEARIKQLEAWRPVETHHHYHYQAPAQITPLTPPLYPYPYNPMQPWCASSGTLVAS